MGAMIQLAEEQSLSGWLDDMAVHPLPGGVSAAALASAMGAALCAKAARVTLQRRPQDDTNHRTDLVALVDSARDNRLALVRLAAEDEQVYRAVLDAGEQASRDRAWQAATEVPIGVAEISQSMLAGLATLENVCWPSVRVDLEIGIGLLEAGVQAGLRAAEANLRQWGDWAGGVDLQLRVEKLRRQALEEGAVD